MLASAFVEQEKVIRENPDCRQTIPSDETKIAFVTNKFRETAYVLDFYDLERDSLRNGLSFDEYLEQVRNRFVLVDDRDMRTSRRRAKNAQITPTGDQELRLEDVMALIARNDPLYVNDTLVQIMRSVNPEFTDRCWMLAMRT